MKGEEIELRFRKKPIVIEAFKYDGDLMDRNGQYYVPEWAVTAAQDGTFFYEGQGELFIKTLEGNHHVTAGDWVIQGVKGELYPCKPEIFEATYESAAINRDSPEWVAVEDGLPEDDSNRLYWITVRDEREHLASPFYVLKDARYYHRWELPMGYTVGNEVVAYKPRDTEPKPYQPYTKPDASDGETK